ncbi:MAG: DNA mismatch repair protein [Bacteroidetes bacterium]|nr:DNA mismatch repair protein [Bacteroidota bacterium]
MSFATDRQTLDDLNIFGQRGGDSIYGLFSHTQTRGGALLMEQFFHEPLSRPDAIRKRIDIFRWFAGSALSFPFKSEWFDAVEQWLANTDERSKLLQTDGSLERKIKGLISTNTEESIIQKGIASLLEMVHVCRDFVSTMAADGSAYEGERAETLTLLEDPVFSDLLLHSPRKRLGFGEVAGLDEQLRFRNRSIVRRLLGLIYHVDLYLTVARVAVTRRFAFPVALDRGSDTVRLQGLYHPGLTGAIPNSITITTDNNIVFLTGANMAGKSTFMKSLGIALYLAHMGFPVAAAAMEFTVLDGLFTTINLADNLGIGASHFYAEVLRVKKVAEELNRGKNLLVIFDELFRGTNVKDAYEATIAITAAFASRRNSIFVLSTHIIEAGETLRQQHANIGFVFLPTRMEGTRPVYTYQLERGITDDRHGMVIIRNEGILDILEKGNIDAS